MMYEVLISKNAKKNVEKQQKYIQLAFDLWVKNELPLKPYEANDGKMEKTEYEG